MGGVEGKIKALLGWAGSAGQTRPVPRYLSMHADSSKVVDWFAVVAECMRKQRLA
jgi:hypothetical protein